MLGGHLSERERELSVLGQHVEDAARGRGGLLSVEGPLGCGRSSLLDQARLLASESGWTVLTSSSLPQSHLVRYSVLRDWFGQLTHQSEPGTEGPFDGPGQVLRTLEPDGRNDPPPSPSEVGYAARWALEELTRTQPVLLVADDLQWADTGSLQAIELLAGGLRPLACLLVGAVRTGERISAPAVLTRICAHGVRLTPQPLSRVAVAAEITARQLRGRDPEEIFVQTEGIPLLVHEVLGNPPGTVPARVLAIVDERLSRMGTQALEVARAVAVLDTEADASVVAQVCDLDAATVEENLAALIGAGLLTDTGFGPRPAAPLLGAAVAAALRPSEHSALQARVAATLRSRGASDAVLADHLRATLPGNSTETRARLMAHGVRLMESGSPEQALQMLERALAEGPVTADDTGLLNEVGRAQVSTGHAAAGLASWRRAWALEQDPDVRLRSQTRAVDNLISTGLHREAGQLVARLHREHPNDAALDSRVVLAGALTGLPTAMIRELVGDRLPADPSPEGGTDSGTDPGTDPLAEAMRHAAAGLLAVLETRDGPRARAHALRAMEGQQLTLAEPAARPALFLAALTLSWTSAFGEDERLLGSIIEQAERERLPLTRASAMACRGIARAQAGRITDALPDLEGARAGRHQGWRAYLAPVLAALADARVATGRLDLAEDLREELTELAEQPGLGGAVATQSLGQLAAVRGNHEVAASILARVGAMVEGRMDNPAILPWRQYEALSRRRLGDGREACRLAAENLRLAEQFGSPYAIAQGLRTQAAVDVTCRPVMTLRRALQTLRGVGARRLEAQVSTDLAGMLMLANPASVPPEVFTLLRSADAYAREQGLRPLGDRAARLLDRLGEPVEGTRNSRVDTLTASERRVADLATSGLSNRQIAAELFVTVKAVEWHLSNVYRKLDISSRRRLPEILGAPQDS